MSKGFSTDLRDYVIGAYSSGNTHRLVCPVCGGGRGEEKSFNVFEVSSGVIGYKCHRSSCGASGRVMAVGVDAPSTSRKSNRSGPNIVQASEEAEAEYRKQFGLSEPIVHRDSFGRDWFYVDLRKHDGFKYGHQYRIIDKASLRDGETKALTYKNEKYPLAFFRNSPYNRNLVVVEDPWSAQRIANLPQLQMDSAAICGGDWLADAAQVCKGKYDEVILCLDRDAQKKAIKQALSHAHIQPVRVVIPRIDIKNMDDEEILDTLYKSDQRR